MTDLGLNSKKLDSVIKDAFKFENRYQMVNDAKMRAVHQTTDYNGFRGMVLGAHLKPVNFRAEPIDEIARRGQGAQKTEGYEATPSSKLYGEKQASPEDILDKLSLETGDEEDAPFWPSGASPATPLQFERDWAKCNNLTLKYRNILGWVPARLGSLLKTNLDGDLLADVFSAVDARILECEAAGSVGSERWGRDVVQIWGVLSSLAKVNRFALARAFLGKADKVRLAAVFAAVRRDCPVGEEVVPAPPTAAVAVRFEPAAVSELKSGTSVKKESEELVRESQAGNAYPMMLPGWEFLGAGTGQEKTTTKADKKKVPKATAVAKPKAPKQSQATPPDAFSNEAAQQLEQLYLEA
jgi:hypothetical protein